tara:strand:+ start:360 stop:638 length:279 start_codon:yes stop_codon:yes gene_type:complete
MTLYTATKITNGFYIRNNTIETIEQGSWMVLDRERNAYCGDEGTAKAEIAWVAKDKNNSEEMAMLLTAWADTISPKAYTKIYTSTEEAQAAL